MWRVERQVNKFGIFVSLIKKFYRALSKQIRRPLSFSEFERNVNKNGIIFPKQRFVATEVTLGIG